MRIVPTGLAAATAIAAVLAATAGATPAPPAATSAALPARPTAVALAAAVTAAATNLRRAPRLIPDASVAEAPAPGAAPVAMAARAPVEPAPRTPAPRTQAEAPARTVTLSAGTGQLVRLARPITGIFIADEKVADVQVKSATQIYLFAKGPGLTSVYATDRAGAVVWSSDVRVGANLADVGRMLSLAMPEARITATPVSGMLLLTGLVLSPRDAEEAQRLTEAFIGQGVQVLNHLKVATPQQVQLQVKIVEVSRSLLRSIGFNLKGVGNHFAVGQGREFLDQSLTPAKLLQAGIGTSLFGSGTLLGVNLISALDLAEQNGLVTTLAEPNLVALSGETASFLAGGEIPVPQSQGLGAVSVEFKQFGVSLAFTPVVLADGRISLHVRPEVSQLSDSGSVKLNGFTIPALTTRRIDTTVELGSGQSFAIGGLLQNNHNNSVDKAPFLGDIPILGALFKSSTWQKQESELVVVVTPYIVRPVDAKDIALPTDGYRSATTVEREFLERQHDGISGASRPMPHPANQ